MKDPDPDCRNCRHAYITYEAGTPYGCRAFGFKSARWPHLVVQESTTDPCGAFEPKPKPANKAKP